MKKRLTNNQRWTLIILSIILAFYLYFSGLIQNFIDSLGQFQVIGVLIAGALFGYAFTAAPATASLISFTSTINPLIVAFVGATGTMIGDLVIFHFFKRGLPKEVKTIFKKSKIEKIKRSKWKWVIPGIAGFIIASPLPDEVGIALLGVTHFDTNSFMLLAFVLNFIGLLIITTAAWLI